METLGHSQPRCQRSGTTLSFPAHIAARLLIPALTAPEQRKADPELPTEEMAEPPTVPRTSRIIYFKGSPGERNTLRPARVVTTWLPVMETTDSTQGGSFAPALPFPGRSFSLGGFTLLLLPWALGPRHPCLVCRVEVPSGGKHKYCTLLCLPRWKGQGPAFGSLR